MTLYARDKEHIKRERAKEAISLALKSQWEEAVTVNRDILKDYPEDVESYNRLGKALSELGQYKEAEDAFRQALSISRANVIARKNLQRLAHLQSKSNLAKPSSKVTPQLFMEESGKTATVFVQGLPPDSTHLRLSPGDAVELKVNGSSMSVETPQGEYLGRIEVKLAARLGRLILGGNQYAAGVVAVDEHNLTIMIKETSQHSSQIGVVSFPSMGTVGDPYTSTRPPLALDMEMAEKEDDSELPLAMSWDDDGEPALASTSSGEYEDGAFPVDDPEDEENN